MTTTDADALRGPWQAVLAWRDGYVTTWNDADEACADHDDLRIAIVRDTAVPTDRDGDGMLRMASTYKSTDHLIEWDGEYFDDLDEVRARWLQAQAMVAGLNIAAATAGYEVAEQSGATQ